MAVVDKATKKEPTPKELLMKMIAENYGPSNAVVMDRVLKNQDKHIDEAMLQHGMSAQDMAKTVGVDLNNPDGSSLQQQPQQTSPSATQAPMTKPASSPVGFGGMSMGKDGQVIEQQPGVLAGLLSTLLTGNPKTSANQDLARLIGVSKLSKEPSLSSQLAQMNYNDKQADVKSVADAMQNGDQLVDFTGLYGKAGAVKAELERRGVNVKQLQLQAVAEKRLASTLNGPQQVRLRQSIDSTLQGLDELDALNSEFDRLGVKAFNKVKIEALANGAGTPEQQDIAQRFKTNINALQEEYGNVIMGGNSPTDKALGLSAKTFNEDYNNTSITAAVKESRRLLKMRMNAIDNVGANSGVATNSPVQAEQTGGGSELQSLKSKYGLQ